MVVLATDSRIDRQVMDNLLKQKIFSPLMNQLSSVLKYKYVVIT